MCTCGSPLRIRHSVGWIQWKRRKLLRSAGNRVGRLSVNFFYAPPRQKSPLRNVANIYILDSPVRPCSRFSDSRWHPPLFPGFPEGGPSAPPSPSSPPSGPPGPRPCLPAPVACLSGQFTPVGRKENKWRTLTAAARLYLPSLLFITEMERLSSATAWLYWRFKP